MGARLDFVANYIGALPYQTYWHPGRPPLADPDRHFTGPIAITTHLVASFDTHRSCPALLFRFVRTHLHFLILLYRIPTFKDANPWREGIEVFVTLGMGISFFSMLYDPGR